MTKTTAVHLNTLLCWLLDEAGPAGRRLAVVDECDKRMMAEGLLPGRGGVLFLGARKDQHAVDVHDHRAVGGRTVRFERVLQIVINQSGRIVTAFPAEKLIALGVTAAGIEAFSERTAKAAETVHASVEGQNALETAANADTSSWWEWVPLIGHIWGGDLSSGESQYLETHGSGKVVDEGA